VVGFTLGTYQVAILVGAMIIGAVSVALSLVGLELGARLGGWGRRAQRSARRRPRLAARQQAAAR